MSIRTMTRVWEHSTHKGSALLLLLAIADHADDHGENAYPQVATLAKKVRMGKREVQYLLRSLEKSGELVVHRRGGGRGRRNVYTVSPPKRVQSLHPLAAEKVQSSAEKVQSSAEKVQPIAPHSYEPSKEPSKEPSAQNKPVESAREAAEAWLRSGRGAKRTTERGEGVDTVV